MSVRFRQLQHECSVTPGERRLIHWYLVALTSYVVVYCENIMHTASHGSKHAVPTHGVYVYPRTGPITTVRYLAQPIGAPVGGARATTSSILVTVNAHSRGRVPRERQLAYRCPQSVRDTAWGSRCISAIGAPLSSVPPFRNLRYSSSICFFCFIYLDTDLIMKVNIRMIKLLHYTYYIYSISLQ